MKSIILTTLIALVALALPATASTHGITSKPVCVDGLPAVEFTVTDGLNEVLPGGTLIAVELFEEPTPEEVPSLGLADVRRVVWVGNYTDTFTIVADGPEDEVIIGIVSYDDVLSDGSADEGFAIETSTAPFKCVGRNNDKPVVRG